MEEILFLLLKILAGIAAVIAAFFISIKFLGNTEKELHGYLKSIFPDAKLWNQKVIFTLHGFSSAMLWTYGRSRYDPGCIEFQMNFPPPAPGSTPHPAIFELSLSSRLLIFSEDKPSREELYKKLKVTANDARLQELLHTDDRLARLLWEMHKMLGGAKVSLNMSTRGIVLSLYWFTSAQEQIKQAAGCFDDMCGCALELAKMAGATVPPPVKAIPSLNEMSDESLYNSVADSPEKPEKVENPELKELPARQVQHKNWDEM